MRITSHWVDARIEGGILFADEVRPVLRLLKRNTALLRRLDREQRNENCIVDIGKAVRLDKQVRSALKAFYGEEGG